jgi:hypothetical protein
MQRGGWVGLLAVFGLALQPALFSQLGTLLAPVLPALKQAAKLQPARLGGLFDDPEADGRGEVESRGGQHRGHKPCSLNVEVGHQQAGYEAAHDALDRQHVHPPPVPGHQPKYGGHKGDR